MATEFYTGSSDVNLGKDLMLQSGILAVQRVIHEVTAAYEDATPDGELTLPASVGTVTDDEFNSVASNLEFIDDDGDVCEVAIKDTVGTTRVVSFVIANAKKIKDNTAAALTDAASYTVRVLTPTLATDVESGAYGKYFGYITALSFEPVNEKAQLKVGIPKELVAEGDIENGYSVSGAVSNVANADILKAIFGADEFGSQTSRFSLAWGSINAARKYYRFHLIASDDNGRKNVFRFLRGRFGINGSMEFISDEYKSLAWKFSGFVDGFYPSDANLFMRVREG
jgi:hypothetical protein